MQYEAIVIGTSSGGLNALQTLLPALPADFPAPVIVVQHISPLSDNYWIRYLDAACALSVKEAEEKEAIVRGSIYVAPPNYHLLVEKDKTFSLTIGEKVNYARPSIDLLFETAAETWQEKLVGIILTGSNSDGTAGIRRIRECGGFTIAQDPATAESSYMPASAIAGGCIDGIYSLEEIINILLQKMYF